MTIMARPKTVASKAKSRVREIDPELERLARVAIAKRDAFLLVKERIHEDFDGYWRLARESSDAGHAFSEALESRGLVAIVLDGKIVGHLNELCPDEAPENVVTIDPTRIAGLRWSVS